MPIKADHRQRQEVMENHVFCHESIKYQEINDEITHHEVSYKIVEPNKQRPCEDCGCRYEGVFILDVCCKNHHL
jgi:hypothetical protein